MPEIALPDIARSWRLFLIQEEAARNYWRSYLMYGLHSHRDPLLDRILPSLLYIKAVTILDDALRTLIATRGLRMPKRYPDSLAGRIDFLADGDILDNRAEFHRVRLRRNELAHETASEVTWEELTRDRAAVHGWLLNLGLVVPPTKLEFYCERSAMRASTREGYDHERDFEYGIKENGKLALQIAWKEFIGGAGSS